MSPTEVAKKSIANNAPETSFYKDFIDPAIGECNLSCFTYYYQPSLVKIGLFTGKL